MSCVFRISSMPIRAVCSKWTEYCVDCFTVSSQNGDQKCSPWVPFPVRVKRFNATHSMRCFLECRFVYSLHSLNIMLYIACNMYCIIALVAFICILCYLISFCAVLRLESLSSGTFSGCVVCAPGQLLFGPLLMISAWFECSIPYAFSACLEFISGCVVYAPGRLFSNLFSRFQRGLSVPFLTRFQRVWNLS